MGFESLIGNERVKANLHHSLQRGRGSHCYLICGPEGSGRHTLARLLAAGLMCTGQEKPCGVCEGCRKVLNGVHPDFITVDDPEKKIVPVELIRQARADIYVQPNEGQRKIYLFPRAQDMAVPGQNALLKILEEPPSYGVFILLADNPERLLPTVRSRCTELQLQPLPEQLLVQELERRFPDANQETIRGAVARSGGYLGQAIGLLAGTDELSQQTAQFAKAFAARDAVELLQLLVSMEKWKRDQMIAVLQQWLMLLEESLVCRAGGRSLSELSRNVGASRSSSDIMAAIRQIQKCMEYAQGNVSPAAICGHLQWALR